MHLDTMLSTCQLPDPPPLVVVQPAAKDIAQAMAVERYANRFGRKCKE